jgi:hypothetical protein
MFWHCNEQNFTLTAQKELLLQPTFKYANENRRKNSNILIFDQETKKPIQLTDIGRKNC